MHLMNDLIIGGRIYRYPGGFKAPPFSLCDDGRKGWGAAARRVRSRVIGGGARTASKSAEVDGPKGRIGGTRRWSQTSNRPLRKAIFYGVFGAPAAVGRESLPLRQPIATSEKPNKTGRFSSHRIRTVENRGGDPRHGQTAIIVASAEARILANRAG
jgi:hypothetical protein